MYAIDKMMKIVQLFGLVVGVWAMYPNQIENFETMWKWFGLFWARPWGVCCLPLVKIVKLDLLMGGLLSTMKIG